MNISSNDLKFWRFLIPASRSDNFCNHSPLFKVLSLHHTTLFSLYSHSAHHFNQLPAAFHGCWKPSIPNAPWLTEETAKMPLLRRINPPRDLFGCAPYGHLAAPELPGVLEAGGNTSGVVLHPPKRDTLISLAQNCIYDLQLRCQRPTALHTVSLLLAKQSSEVSGVT